VIAITIEREDKFLSHLNYLKYKVEEKENGLKFRFEIRWEGAFGRANKRVNSMK
jgi:FKBP-type peptidyl-prolyl cis-trans isomerase 2